MYWGFQGGHEFSLARQLIGLNALHHIVLKKHGDLTRLRGGALSLQGKHVIPPLCMEDTGEQRGAEHIAHNRARHACLENGQLLASNYIALHHINLVRLYSSGYLAGIGHARARHQRGASERASHEGGATIQGFKHGNSHGRYDSAIVAVGAVPTARATALEKSP